MSIVSNASSSYYLSCVDRLCESSSDRAAVKKLSESSVRSFCRWRGCQSRGGRNLSDFLDLLRKAVDSDGNCQLDQSILSRKSDWSVLLNEQNLGHLNEIYSHPANVTACFIKYSGCLNREYYENGTASEILSSFSCLLDRLDDDESYDADQFLPYDQGGKEHLQGLLHGRSLHGASSIQQVQSSSEILKDPEYADVFSEESLPYLERVVSRVVEGDVPEANGRVFIEWCKTFKEVCGDDILSLLLQAVSNEECLTFEQLNKLMQELVLLSDDLLELTSLLERYSDKEISFVEVLRSLESLHIEAFSGRFSDKNLDEVQAEFSEDNPALQAPLQKDELALVFADYRQIFLIGEGLKGLGKDELLSMAAAIKERCSSSEILHEDALKLIAIGREVMLQELGIYPYNTQIIALLGLLQVDSKPELLGRIAQVKTGEGKSTVITLMAFFLAMQGKTVDIISSSRYLASRDQKKYEEFYRLFGIKTSHICTDNPTPECFSGQILYGTNHDFEFAVLRDMLWNTGYRNVGKWCGEEKPFNCVIVDEVDNLFIDTAMNSARLGITAKVQVNWVYEPILEFVRSRKDLIQAMPIESFTDGLREELMGLQSGANREFIANLSERHLAKWVASAYSALFFHKVNENYVIKPVEVNTNHGTSVEKQVIIVDAVNTGRLMMASRWSHGLHEFLEAKHGLSIANESLTPASIAHPAYFKFFYERLYGLTGTMGSEVERAEVSETYKVDTFDVPTYRQTERTAHDIRICDGDEEHYRVLLEEIQSIQESGRPILLLFETIAASKGFAEFLQEQNLEFQLLNEMQDENEDFVITRAGNPATITLATNTSGRGTDIVLHPASRDNGGLHVVFTFYPQNARVEAQGFGRAARQGQEGSSRLILEASSQPVQEQVEEDENFLSLSAGEMLERLQVSRQKHVEKLSAQRVLQANVEITHFEHLAKFGELFTAWREELDEEYISDLAVKLYALPATDEEDFDQSDEGRVAIANSLVAKLQNPTGPEVQWSTLLKKVKEHLCNSVTQDWAIYFHEELSDLPRTGSLHSYQDRVAALYEESKEKWGAFIENPKADFIRYLGELTGQDVSHLLQRREEVEVNPVTRNLPTNWRNEDRLKRTHLHKVTNLEEARFLIERGLDVNARDSKKRTPLHYASCPEIAELLINEGADVEARDKHKCTPIHTVLYRLSDEDEQGGIDYLGEHLAHYFRNPPESKMKSIVKPHKQRPEAASIVKMLLSKGANPNTQDFQGNTVLHKARRKDLMKLLVKNRKTDLTVQNEWKATALHYAYEMPDGVIEVLLGANFDVNQRDEYSFTPKGIVTALTQHSKYYPASGANLAEYLKGRGQALRRYSRRNDKVLRQHRPFYVGFFQDAYGWYKSPKA